MKNFIKSVFANVIALIIVAAMCFGFFILLIVSSSSEKDAVEKIKENSILVLNFNSKVIEAHPESQFSIFDFEKKEDLVLYDVIEAIKEAKNDSNIKGISIEVDNIDAGITQVDEIRNALEDFKKSGKFIYSYGNSVSQSSYYLSSIADQYYLNPVGEIELKGLSTEVVFLKDFAEKFGIGIDVIRHGKFKAAVEPFIRNDISEENKEQLATLLNDIWKDTSEKIAKSRKIELNNLNTSVDSLYGVIPELSVQNKLVDKLVHKSEYINILKNKLNIKKEDDLNSISIAGYVKNTNSKKVNNSNKIAVLYASGQIYNGKNYRDIHSENYIKQIKELAKDDEVKAVVLRINSPGGSANASDQILYELQQLKTKKPLIVSFGDYAASGGYYIAMAGEKIFCEPKTITGSIGVFGVLANFKELANRNGIRADVVSTHSNSNTHSPISGLTPGTERILTRSVEGTYKRFVHFVGQNRKMSFEQVDAIGGGRVWSGVRAKEIGLVDEIGSLHNAIEYASKRAKLKEYSVESFPKKINDFELYLSSMAETSISQKYIEEKIGKENYPMFEKITNPQFRTGVEMSMPYTIKIK